MITFGTNGFRARMSEDFTKSNIQKITQAMCNIIKKEKSTKPVLIGFDRRFMSDYFAKWCAEVFAGNQIKTLIYDRPIPTPAVYFGVKKEDLDYGIMITASHNPYVYNGYKITTKGGYDANEEFTTKLQNLSNKVSKIKTMDFDNAKKEELILSYDNSNEYIKNLDKFVSKNLKGSTLKILFNAMYGVTAEPAKLFAKHFKLENMDIINADEDPYFHHTLPCPNEENLEEFKKQIIKGRYKIGLACDADGDRLGIIDEQGTYYNNNIIMAIIYYYLAKYRNITGDIVRTYSTSTILDNLAEKFGCKVYETPIGIKWVTAKMTQTDALLGGESSGGLTMKGYTPSKDSMFSIALFLDAIATIGKPISKVVEEVKKFSGYISTYIEGNLTVTNRNKFNKLLAKKSPNFSYKPTSIIRDDGVKYLFEGGNWILIRFSGTENLLRYYIEFQTEIECERNLKAINTFVNNFNNDKKNK